MRRRIVAIASACALAAFVWWALRAPPVPVELGSATRGPLEVTVDEEGETRVRSRFVVAAPATGRLLRITLALISWSGSMFEYLMPSLVMRAPAGSLIEQTSRLVVRRQVAYGAARGVPWGILESAYNVRDLELTYQYSNFGVPGLGLKRGLSENTVVAPYATALAAMVDPGTAARNFTELAAIGAQGRFGFYEALDYTRSRLPKGNAVAIVRAFMAHHQGMTVVAIGNALLEGRMRARFHAEPIVQATELLLQERTPRVRRHERRRAGIHRAPEKIVGTRFGVFFVTACNHEGYAGLRRCLEFVEKAGIRVLFNEVVDVDGLSVMGIAYPGIRDRSEIRGLDRVLDHSNPQRPLILLFHTPADIRQDGTQDRRTTTYWRPDTSFALSKELGVSLQLSGHTHKGQIFPFGYLTGWIYNGWDSGLHSEDGFSLYTSSGVGTWGPPMRTGTAPEIAVITLK